MRLVLACLLGFTLSFVACGRETATPDVVQPPPPLPFRRGEPPSLPTVETLPTAAVADALQLGFRCFALPGTARTAIVPGSPAGQVWFTEPHVSGDPNYAAYRLVSVDLATAATSVLLEHAGVQPIALGGGRFVTHSTTLGLAQVGSDQGPDLEWLVPDAAFVVRTFLVDRQGKAAFWTDAGGRLWRNRIDGGEDPKPIGWAPEGFGAPHVKDPALVIGEATDLWHVDDDGNSLIITGNGTNGPELQRLPVDGSPAKRLGPAARQVRVMAAGLLVEDLNGSLWRIPLAGGALTPVPGAEPGDRILADAVEPFVTRHKDGNVELLAFDGERLQLLVALGPVQVRSAGRVPGGVLAALVVHDTDLSGGFEAGDEADVCLLAPTVRPLTMAQRPAPLRFAAQFEALRTRLVELGIRPVTQRILRDPLALSVQAQGAPPSVAPDDVLALLRRAQDEVSRLTGASELPLVVEWPDAGRRAWTLRSPDGARFLHRIAVGDTFLTDPKDFSIVSEARAVVTRRGFVGEAQVSCAGNVRNTGSAPLELEAVCLAAGATEYTNEKVLALGTVAPGEQRKWSISWGAAGPGRDRAEIRYRSARREVVAFDVRANADLTDWLLVLDKVRTQLGFRPVPQPAPSGHDTLHFYVPPGFAELTTAERERRVQALWTEVARHLAKGHDGRPAALTLQDAEGRTWTMDKRGLRPAHTGKSE
jgi:hypothetical protein